MRAAMWKVERKGKGGRPPKNCPQRCGELMDTPAEAMMQFEVSRRKHDEATQVLGAAPGLAKQVHAGDIKLKEAMACGIRAWRLVYWPVASKDGLPPQEWIERFHFTDLLTNEKREMTPPEYRQFLRDLMGAD